MTDRESVKVLHECIDLQNKKSNDYQNSASSVKQAMHYRRGVDTIHDMLHQKMLRALSLIEAAHGPTATTPNFESLEDTYKDIINYASFAVSYMRGKMDGQDPHKDMFNQVKPLDQIDLAGFYTEPIVKTGGWEPVVGRHPADKIKYTTMSPADWTPPAVHTPAGFPHEDSIARTAREILPPDIWTDDLMSTGPSHK